MFVFEGSPSFGSDPASLHPISPPLPSMKSAFILFVLLAIARPHLSAFEEVEPNSSQQPNTVLTGNIITGTLPVSSFPLETDVFRIRINHRVPVTVWAKLRVVSGAAPSEVGVSLRVFSDDQYQASSYGNGQTSAAFSFHHLFWYPSDLFLQIGPASAAERYELTYVIAPIDKAGPKITFGRRYVDTPVRRVLGPNTRSVPFQLHDLNGLAKIEARAEGDYYREIGIPTRLMDVRRHLRTRFRFQHLRPIETVYIRATDQLGNVSVHSFRYKRIESRSALDGILQGGRN